MADWKELWLNNYKGVGDTADLEKHLKKLGYGARNNISYLPWAVVERIFRLQGGDVHWLSATENSRVDADIVGVETVVDRETGETNQRTINAYFINIHAQWQGRDYTERYPLQDSNGRALLTWTQNELNKAFQRGKVKAIAIVSGIGYKLFEDGDLQFDEDEQQEVVKTGLTIKKEKPVQVAEPSSPPSSNLLIKEIPKRDRAELEQEIKKEFLSGEKKANIIKKYLAEKEVKKIGELNEEQIIELNDLIQ